MLIFCGKGIGINIKKLILGTKKVAFKLLFAIHLLSKR